jgi:hypothetical protein
MKRLRDESKAKLLAQIRVDFGAQKQTTEAVMVDANMGGGGGGPPPPPGAAGFVMREVDTINKKKTRQSPYGPQVFNIGSDRGKRGGPKPGPAPDMPAYTTEPPIIQPPQQVYLGGSRANKLKQTKNDKLTIKKGAGADKITITRGKKGKKTDKAEEADIPAPPPPAPPPAPAPAGAKIDKKTGKMKPVKKGAGTVKALNGLPASPAVAPTPIPAPALPPPNNPPGLKIRLIGKQKKPPNTTKAEKKQAAIDALAAAKAAADTATVLLPDAKPKGHRASVKRKPQEGDPAAPDPTEPAVVKIRKAAVAKITKPKAIAKPKRPASTPQPDIVQTTTAKRGPGPDDQPAKKVKQEPTRKRGKPEEDPAAPEEEPRIGITPTGGMTVIKAPGKITVEELISKVRYAIKNNLLSDELRKAYIEIGLQLDDQAKDINKKDEKSLKDIYRQGVWNKAKGQAPGGGRYSAVY